MPHTSNKTTVSSLKERLAQSAINVHKAAHRLEPGIEREALVAKAHNTEAAIQINEWLSSRNPRSRI